MATRVLAFISLFVLITFPVLGQNSFCDEIGPASECIQKSDRQLDQDRYRFSYIFQMEKSSFFESHGGQPNFQIFNLTLISGTWRGSFNISSNDTKIKSGAKFRPENGNIVIGTELPSGDVTFPTSTARGCQWVKYRNQSADSGVYEIDPDGDGGISPFKVYCQMNSNGGWNKVEMSGYLDKSNGDSFGCGSRNNVFIFSEAVSWSEWTSETYWNQDNPIPFSRMDHIDDSSGTGDGEEFCGGDALDKFGLESEGEEYDDRPTEFTRMDVDYFATGASTGRLTESQENSLRMNIDHLSPQTQVFSATSDDDGCNYNGEWFIYASDNGQKYHLTPWSTGSETGVNDDWGKHNTGSGNTGGHGYTFSNGNFSMPAKASAFNGATDDCSGPSTWGIFGYEKGYALVNEFAKSCQEIRNRIPSASSGRYRIDPDGAGGVTPFKVYCEMDQDGGGWIRLKISNHESDRVVTNDHGGSYGFQDNCGSYDGQDDKYYRGTDDLSWSKSTNTGEFTYDVDYSTGGSSLSESQEQALRDLVENISGGTRSVSLTCDDDGDSKSGHEVTLTDGSGDTFTTTEQTDVSGSGFIGFWVHSTDKRENTFDAIDTTFTGSGPANRSLPQDFVMPAEMTADINSGGAVAWGYEQDYVLVK